MKYERSCGAVVFTRDGDEAKYVIIKMKSGCHGFPKGRVEGDETEEETAHREIYEEVGLKVDFIDDFKTVDEYPYPGRDVIKHVTYFLAEYEDQLLVPQEEEITEISLVPYDEAISLLEFESARRVLKEADDFIKENILHRVISIYGYNRTKPYEIVRKGCRGIVVDDGKILVSRLDLSGEIMIPGGGIEGDESLEDCCRRELEEETGYIVEPEKCFLELEEYYREYKFVDYYFVCRIVGTGKKHLTPGEIEERLSHGWMDVDEFMDILSRYSSWIDTNEERSGLYLREYTAMREYLEYIKKGKI